MKIDRNDRSERNTTENKEDAFTHSRNSIIKENCRKKAQNPQKPFVILMPFCGYAASDFGFAPSRLMGGIVHAPSMISLFGQ